MSYYAVQVLTGGEERFLELARQALRSLDPDQTTEAVLIWPRRRLSIWKKGAKRESLAPIFPGYVFLETDDLSAELHSCLRRITGFCRFLRDNHNVEPLSGDDCRLLQHFLSFGEVVEKSRVFYDENRRIRVIGGALKGLEGQIVKVDRRKKRAKVALALYNGSFMIDFGFEVLEPVERHNKKPGATETT